MQIVGYDTGASTLRYDPAEGPVGTVEAAALLLAEDGDVTRYELQEGTTLTFALQTRQCAGILDDEIHIPCDAEEAPYCAEHVDRWPCARCTGECDRPLPACRTEHAVYLAAFAPETVKVGVTRLRRLYTRLREQGADRAAHIHSVSDGRLARRIEREIAADIPDRVSPQTKIEGLYRSVDESVWTDIVSDFTVINTMSFDYDLDLTERPMVETIAAGRVRGTKGRLLILERSSGIYAVDMRNLLGYMLDTGPTERELQSSLTSFG